MAQAAGAVIGIGASVFGMYSQQKAMEEQQKAMKEQRRLQRAADERERRQLLRSQAIAAGQTVNVAAQIGGLGGTGLTGGLSGLQNQVLSTLGFQQMSARSINKQQGFLNNAAQYQTNAGIAEGVGALGSGLMGTTFGQNLVGGIGARISPKMANPIQSYGTL
jgi:hypothetical protein